MGLGNSISVRQLEQLVLFCYNFLVTMPCSMEDIELTPVTCPRPVDANPDADERRPATQSNDVGHEIAHGELTGHALAPTDGGPAAWRLLVAAFVFEALLWGTRSSHLWAGSNEAD